MARVVSPLLLALPSPITSGKQKISDTKYLLENYKIIYALYGHMVNQDEQGTLVKNTSWVPIFVTRRDVFLKLKKHKVGSIYLSEMKAEEFVIY